MHLESSGIRKLFELGSRLKNPVDLSLGQPDFDVPEIVREAAVRAIQSGKNRYTPTAGIPELRAALTAKLRGEKIATAESVMVTAGASGGLLLALLALADEEADVYYPDPYFLAYPQMIRLSEAEGIPIDTYPGFKLTPERLERAVLSRPVSRRRILLFNSPCNPTGVAYSSKEMMRLARKARELEIQVISDEVYDEFHYEERPRSWLCYDPEAVLVRAFSKTGGIPGWRVGYAVAPDFILQEMLKLQQFSFVCVNTPAQWACLELLGADFKEMRDSYRERRDFLARRLQGTFDFVKPGGSFFAFAALPGCDGDRFAALCLERELLIVPGSLFSRRSSHFRISFSAKEDVLEKGVSLLLEVALKEKDRQQTQWNRNEGVAAWPR